MAAAVARRLRVVRAEVDIVLAGGVLSATEPQFHARLADELAIMATAIARRLRVVRSEVDVVLAGGVFRTAERGFHERVELRLEAAIPRARIRRLVEPPVLGAALLGLDGLGVRRGGAAERRLRDAFSARLSD